MIQTELVTIEMAGDGSSMGGYLARPAGDSARRTGVIVAHELFGVTADIRGVVDHLATLGHIAIAPEFYHRTVVPGTSFARDADGRERGFAQLRQLTRDQAVRDVRAAMRYLADMADPICMLGFSLGGHIAYLAATQCELAATAVLYGGWLTTTEIPLGRPEPTVDLTPGITGQLHFLVGGGDHLITTEHRDQLTAALTNAGVRHELVVYPDASHAFFWEHADTFHRESRDDAWLRIEKLFASVS